MKLVARSLNSTTRDKDQGKQGNKVREMENEKRTRHCFEGKICSIMDSRNLELMTEVSLRCIACRRWTSAFANGFLQDICICRIHVPSGLMHPCIITAVTVVLWYPFYL